MKTISNYSIIDSKRHSYSDPYLDDETPISAKNALIASYTPSSS